MNARETSERPLWRKFIHRFFAAENLLRELDRSRLGRVRQRYTKRLINVDLFASPRPWPVFFPVISITIDTLVSKRGALSNHAPRYPSLSLSLSPKLSTSYSSRRLAPQHPEIADPGELCNRAHALRHRALVFLGDLARDRAGYSSYSRPADRGEGRRGCDATVSASEQQEHA